MKKELQIFQSHFPPYHSLQILQAKQEIELKGISMFYQSFQRFLS